MYAMLRSHPLQPATLCERAAALLLRSFKGASGSDELEPAQPISTGGGMIAPPGTPSYPLMQRFQALNAHSYILRTETSYA
jgi:hypothetical protein